MALIKCPECGKMISDKAELCVGCGYPVKLILQDNDDFDDNESFVDDDTDYVVLGNGEPRNMGENMATSSAKEYLETQGFSKQGLIEQLEFDGYTRKEPFNNPEKEINEYLKYVWTEFLFKDNNELDKYELEYKQNWIKLLKPPKQKKS